MWQVPSQEAGHARAWRFSLVDPETDEKHGFPDLAALTGYLLGQMESSADESAPTDPVEK
jgi:hypothetical protein